MTVRDVRSVSDDQTEESVIVRAGILHEKLNLYEYSNGKRANCRARTKIAHDLINDRTAMSLSDFCIPTMTGWIDA